MLKNKNYKKIIESIDQAHYILILTHKNPDADTLCSALTLSNYLYENRKKHKVLNISKELPLNLNFLPNFDKITHTLPKKYDLVIYVDCADKARVGDLCLENVTTINIDHHQSNTNFATLNCVNPSKGSTAEVLYDILELNSIKISKNMASCLYVGIYDDNIAFTTPRTDAQTFEVVNKLVQTGIDVSYIAKQYLSRDTLAKYRILPKILDTLVLYFEGKFATIYLDTLWLKETGATLQECDDTINMILNIAIVEVAAFFREIDGVVRVSLRSKNEIDVSKIASNFEGGGHKNAEGLTMKAVTITKEKKKILDVVKNYI